MAKNENNGALERQWKILKLLPSRGAGVTSTKITEIYARDNDPDLTDVGSKDYKALKRKIQRDLDILQSLDLVDCNDKGRPFGWTLRPDSRFLANQSPAEALFLLLAEKSIEPLMPRSLLEPLTPAFDQARKTLNDSSQRKSRLKNKLVSIRPIPLLSATISQEILDIVYQALEQEKVLEIDYRRAITSDLKTYRLNLHGIMHRPPSVYLLASVGDYDDILHFALHRIEDARLSTLSARNSDISLGDLEKQGDLYFGNKGNIELELRASAITARLLSETPLAVNQQVVASENSQGQHFRVTATVNDTWDLRFWILSQGQNVEVIQPQSLRQQIHEELEAALKNYQ